MDAHEPDGGAPLPELTEAAAAYLKAAGPWMFFLGILGFIGCGVMLLAGIIMAVSSTLDIFDFLKGSELLIGLFYAALAVVSFFPARFLFLAGSKLRLRETDLSTETLETALRNNASFWKFYGILSIVTLSLIVVSLLVVIIVAVSGI